MGCAEGVFLIQRAKRCSEAVFIAPAGGVAPGSIAFLLRMCPEASTLKFRFTQEIGTLHAPSNGYA